MNPGGFLTVKRDVTGVGKVSWEEVRQGGSCGDPSNRVNPELGCCSSGARKQGEGHCASKNFTLVPVGTEKDIREQRGDWYSPGSRPKCVATPSGWVFLSQLRDL